ncbi:MAG TPA: hypothetical protein VGG40_01590 [Solirubrobacterales bacterium]|jgi:hypothetical protein
MELALALTAVQKAAAVLAVTGIVGPAIGFALKRAVGGWSAYGSGPFSILTESSSRRDPAPQGPVDPAIQAAEVRQMLAAKDERLRRRGEPGLDVEAEAERLLAAAAENATGGDGGEELRAEVRQLVVLRNERRLRQGLEPLDVEAETERELADLLRSR